MSEKSSHKKERRRSSSSSSYSSTSSDSSDEPTKKTVKDIKEQPRPANPVVNKMKLDIGYKIQQEELSDSEGSDGGSPLLKALPVSNNSPKLLESKDKKRERSVSKERKKYRSPSIDKKRERSRSKDSRKGHSQSKELKASSKHSDLKYRDGKKRSRSKERKRERSKSRDRKKRRSKSRERKSNRSSSRDRKKERSRSKDRKRDRSKSKDRGGSKVKRKERSRSREKRREKVRRDSRSPSYYKDSKSHIRSKRGRSRDKSSKRSRSRSRSRSRPHKRTRSRSRSFERSKRPYDKKFNKLNILEKLGIELKVPEGHVLGEAGANSSGFSIPSYYNPAGVNPLKYAQQMQKRRLIWGSKKQEGEPSTDKKVEEAPAKPEASAGPESVWKGTTFSQDQDGKLTAKFKRLMGIKDAGGEEASEKNTELIQKQEEMFSSMEKQYEVARVSTHTHRGLGLGFGVHLPR